MKPSILQFYIVFLCVKCIGGSHGREFSATRISAGRNRRIKQNEKIVPYILEQPEQKHSEARTEIPEARSKPHYKCKCGVSNGNDERIVGGYETDPNEFPWQVGLAMGQSKQPFCGASVLNDYFILTAAHCTQGDPKDVSAIFAEHDIKNDVDHAFRIKVRKFINHPSYNTTTIVNDISLGHLVSRVPFSRIVRPPCFPTPNFDYEGDIAMVSGWGFTSEKKSRGSTTLQKVEVPIVSRTECRDFFVKRRPVLETALCAAWEEGQRDACKGDSGGPLIWYEDGRWYQIGLVSWGVGCARSNTPAVYTRVDKYYDWIDQQIDSLAATCSE